MRRIPTEIRKKIRNDYQNGVSTTDLAIKYGVSKTSAYKIAMELDRTDYKNCVSLDDCMRMIRSQKEQLEAELSDAKAKLEQAQQHYDQFIIQMHDIFEGGAGRWQLKLPLWN